MKTLATGLGFSAYLLLLSLQHKYFAKQSVTHVLIANTPNRKLLQMKKG